MVLELALYFLAELRGIGGADEGLEEGGGGVTMPESRGGEQNVS